MRRRSLMLLFLFIVLLAHAPADAARKSRPPMRVYGYLVSWALKMDTGSSNYETCPYTSIDWDACTDYIMFDAAFTSTGRMQKAYDWATGDSTAWHYSYFEHTKRRLLNDVIHARGKSVQLCFFESSGTLAALAASPTIRATMIRTIVDSVIGPANRYDGVHWDIEPMDVADTAALRSFLKEVRDTLDHYRQWVNPSAPPLQTVAIYNTPAFWGRVASSVDGLLHMSYDMFGSWNYVTWLNAPLYDTGFESANVGSIKGYTEGYLAAGIPAAKLVMACPFNYNAYTGGVSTAGEGVYAPGLPMTTFPTWINTNNEMYSDAWAKWIDTATVTLHHDSVHQAAWIGINHPGSANDSLILFQDTTSIRAILEYINGAGIQGAMVWEICGAYIANVNQARHPGLASDHLLQAVKQVRLRLLTTDVEETARAALPARMSLMQNYPNPCNPTTTIVFVVPEGRGAVVRLSVFDLLGREVAVLADGPRTPGEHSVRFDGRGLASGVYLYRLKAGDASLTRALVLLK